MRTESVETTGRLVEDLAGGGRRVLEWWVQELKDMLPTRSSGARQSQKSRIVIALDRETPDIFLETPKGRLEDAAVGGGMLSDRIRNALLLWPSSAIRIRVGDRQFFRRTTRLPARAHREYSRILDLELERDTPFPPGTVLSGYRLLGRPDRRGLQDVEHLVVKRSLVRNVVEEIRKAGGSTDGVDCWDPERAEALPVILPLGVEPVSHSRKLTIGIVAILVALSVAAIWQFLARQHTAIQTLQAQAALLTPSIKEATERTKADRMLTDITARLTSLRDARLPASVVLDRVTRALPDNTWLDTLKIDQDSLEISGLSQTASALLPLLESAACCSDVRLAGPVRYDPDHDRERFQIKARIRAATEKPGVPEVPVIQGSR